MTNERPNNRLKEIAKEYFFINDRFHESNPWEQEELREYRKQLDDEVLKSPYLSAHIDLIGQYMNEYQTLTVEQYYKWIKE